MIVQRFLLWSRTASTGQRAEGASALARAYLYSDLSADDFWQAETALTSLLDDAPGVRRAIAEAFANAVEAPRHIVTALASDQPDIAALVLSRSPVLADPDLIDCATLGGEAVQTAIASRPWVSFAITAALAEMASPSVLIVLAENQGADISDASFGRILDRHGADASLRGALLARPDTPLLIRQAIAASLAKTLSAFVVGCGWLSPERSERVTREARERTTVALSVLAEEEEVGRLVAHLRQTGQLTPVLILRAVLSCRLDFAAAALAELSGLSRSRIAGLLHAPKAAGFAALCRKAGLPESLRPAFAAALEAWRETVDEGLVPEGARVSRRMVERALSACSALPPEETGKLLALLRRFESEAAREEARDFARAMADDSFDASAGRPGFYQHQLLANAA